MSPSEELRNIRAIIRLEAADEEKRGPDHDRRFTLMLNMLDSLASLLEEHIGGEK